MFFRESNQRRKLIPNVPLLCETRWTHKYKSLRIFAENVTEIVKQLEYLEESGKSKQVAHQLLCAVRTPTFVVCLVIIQKYSSKLESVTQKLQSVHLDLLAVQKYIEELLTTLAVDRQNCDERYKDIFRVTKGVADDIGVDIQPPRQAGRQMNRENPKVDLPEDYFRITVFIPYLDSIISSLETRFCVENKPAFSLLVLHPFLMTKLERLAFKDQARAIAEYYAFDNFIEESETWYDIWKCKTSKGEKTETMTLCEVLDETNFFPMIKMAFLTALALPVTTCTIERSFSTLRRVKTWLRSTTGDDRLSGLCMMSIHRKRISQNKEKIIENVINRFGQIPRRLQFLFQDK